MAPSDPSANGGDHEVFGALPRTRPQRRSAKRDRPPSRRRAPSPNGTAAVEPPADTAGEPKAVPGAPAARAAKPKAVAEAPTARTAKPKAVAEAPAARAAKPKASSGAAKSSARSKIGADATRARKPAAVPDAPADIPAAGYATPAEARKASEPDILSTVIHAYGELVEIGATVASQALKSVLGRFPRA